MTQSFTGSNRSEITPDLYGSVISPGDHGVPRPLLWLRLFYSAAGCILVAAELYRKIKMTRREWAAKRPTGQQV
ncbi:MULTISPECIES: hypothetical protein [Asaia]|uniref:Uncharacterized protein n=1 Tax=Asaia spathodeae TaxID=657016 RepID=A0ABX2P875_9PROT|nr:hypothetical protein [Asaia spathodeae]GBR20397.1 hypothetical protein AA105894_2550 [Asaia spathodeae NBRC 105894]